MMKWTYMCVCLCI